MPDPLRVVLATRNEDKIREIRHILSALPVAFLSLMDFAEVPEIVEDGATFLENARKKALAVWEHTGLTSLADDSGLEVEALGGLPGVMSRRYAGPDATYADNNAKLLERLRGILPESRKARFVCVAALVTAAGKFYFAEGELRGLIAESPAGTGGFGYDPLFYLPEHDRTVAEINTDLKNTISHRARAMGAMREIIGALAASDS